MRAFAFVLAVSCLACTRAPEAMHAHHRFDDADAWAARFEDPSRGAWQKPDEVLAALALPPDAKVADLGAATGYFAVRLARAVPKGVVYGVDVESAMVKYLEARAEKESVLNLKAVLAAYDDAKLPEQVDLILIVDTYHHLDARPAYFTKLKASLKPGGRLAVIDFSPDSKLGPPKDQKLAAAAVEEELGQAGFAVSQRHTFLPEQYFLVFTAP